MRFAAGSRAWVFDLDNTLHDARPHIFPHIDRSMTAYLAEHLALPEAEANELRTRYWRRYGATLVGLIRHHGIDPHHFLRQTHDVPNLHASVVGRQGLRAALKRLRGRRVVFSNAPEHYARGILRALGIDDLFDGVFCIEHTRFRPKPDARGFRTLLRAQRLIPSRCIMVEDSLENLRTAKRLGMKTVWVDASHRAPAWLDARVRHVTRLPRLAHLL
jgi:putative hydrolase of the HAD superfamily